jgi:hypothetical protein
MPCKLAIWNTSAQLIGMNNCAGSSCAWCELWQGLFGTGRGNKRSRHTIDANYQTHLRNRILDKEKGLKSKTKHMQGIQSHWLLNSDPRETIIPALHVKIRLINKFNEEVTSGMQLNIKVLISEYNAI